MGNKSLELSPCCTWFSFRKIVCTVFSRAYLFCLWGSVSILFAGGFGFEDEIVDVFAEAGVVLGEFGSGIEKELDAGGVVG